MFKIGICEDNKDFSLELKSIIEKKLFKYNIDSEINCFYSGEDLLNDVLNSKNKYHVIFFDIELPGENGIDIGRKIRKFNDDTIFIFISNLNHKVYEALDLRIFHFIRKNHFYEEVDLILDPLIEKLDHLTEKYLFPIGDRNIYFKLHHITYIEVLDRSVIVHTIDKAYTSNYRSLKDIPYDLKKKHFFEIYRGMLVNLNHVKDFKDNEVILSNKECLYIARRRLNDFKKAFYKYLASKRGA